MRCKTIINESGEDHVYDCINGFVSRVVSTVHGENFADARRVMEILNAHFAAQYIIREECAKIADIAYDNGPKNPYSYDGGATSIGWNSACINIAEKIRNSKLTVDFNF